MARAPKKEDSVFDFLYADQRRIAVFLSQFSQYGHLTSATRTVSDTVQKEGSVGLATIAKMGGSDAATTSLSSQFDPQWLSPLKFLDEVQKRGLMRRQLKESRLGSVVLLSGALTYMDSRVTKGVWDIPGLREALNLAIGKSKETQQALAPIKDGNDEVAKSAFRELGEEKIGSLMLEFCKLAPLNVHCLLATKEGGVWGSLRDDSMLGDSSDLILKHGTQVAGRWSMVGILDAMAEDPVPKEGDPPPALTEKEKTPASFTGIMSRAAAMMAPAARSMLGRPRWCYGITPIVIFREVTA